MLTFWDTNCRIGRRSEYVCCWYGVGLYDSPWQVDIDSHGSVDICVALSIQLGEITLFFLLVLIVFSGFIISATFAINIAAVYFASGSSVCLLFRFGMTISQQN